MYVYVCMYTTLIQYTLNNNKQKKTKKNKKKNETKTNQKQTIHIQTTKNTHKNHTTTFSINLKQSAFLGIWYSV